MHIYDRDTTSLWDMLQAIQRIQEFTQELSLEEYLPSGGSRLPLLQNNKVIDHTTLSATVSSGQSPVAEN
jgi:uncharacterized protein with HEPN domain